nr:probable LRR receptor-like serine/threonine-protein kinase At3g47570 [Ipomoea batatas]
MSSLLNSTATLLVLYLSNCNFGGVLPRFIANFSSLEEFLIAENVVSGTIPSEIGLLGNLQYLDLSENQLGGTIPSSWGSTLPSTIGALSSLIELNINHNLFHGVIPPSFTSLKSLEILDLSCNNLIGKIPEFLGKLQYLKRLNLSFNHLEGEIPTEGIFKNKTEVEVVGNNDLCGCIPQFGLPKCPRGGERQHLSHIQKLAILMSSGTLILLIIVALIVFICKQKNKQPLTLDATAEFMPKLSYWKYGMGSDLSTFGDMYSYGILLLEIFTSKCPTSDIFNNGLTLHNYVRMSMPEQVIEIVDPKLFNEEANATPRSLVLQNQIIECLVSIFKIGIACSMELPRDRMSIGDAVKELHSIKDTIVKLGDIRTIPR